MKFLFAAQWSVPVGLLGLLAGCAPLSAGPTVVMRVVNVRPLQSTISETDGELTLRLTNEAARPIVFAGSTQKFSPNDTAVSSEGVTVPAFGSGKAIATGALDLAGLGLMPPPSAR